MKPNNNNPDSDYLPDHEPKQTRGMCTDGNLQQFKYKYSWIYNGKTIHIYECQSCETGLALDTLANDFNYNANTLDAMTRLAKDDTQLTENLNTIVEQNEQNLYKKEVEFLESLP